MAVAGVTGWIRPPLVLNAGGWSDSTNANDGNPSSFASYVHLSGGGDSGTWGGFDSNSLGLPIDAIITGIQVKATGSEDSNDTGPYLFVITQIDDRTDITASVTTPDFYSIGDVLTRSSSFVGEFGHATVQNILYPLTLSELYKIKIRCGWGGSVDTTRTVVLYLYDIQVQFSYLIPNEGYRFRETDFKTGNISNVNSAFSLNTIVWQNPTNASSFDNFSSTLAEGKEDSTVLFGSNWQFNIPINATPIAIVPRLIGGTNNTFRYSSATWEYRASNGSSLSSAGDSSRNVTGWIGGKGLLTSGVPASVINSSWFGFGFRRDEDVVGDFTQGARSSIGDIDLFSAKIIYEEFKSGGIILLAGF